jgi:putative sterol carrier protein
MKPACIPASMLGSIRGKARGLKGVPARLGLDVAGTSAGVLQVEESGDVEIVPDGEATTQLAVDSYETLAQLLSGDMSPMIAYLQGRLRAQGDSALVVRVLLGLQVDSPWKNLAQRVSHAV